MGRGTTGPLQVWEDQAHLASNSITGETNKTWKKNMYANLTSLITEVIGYPFVYIVPNNPGLMVITNVDNNKFNSLIAAEMSVQLL